MLFETTHLPQALSVNLKSTSISPQKTHPCETAIVVASVMVRGRSTTDEE